MAYIIKFKNKGKIGYYDGIFDTPVENPFFAHQYSTEREARAVAAFDLFGMETTVGTFPDRQSDNTDTVALLVMTHAIAFLLGIIICL